MVVRLLTVVPLDRSVRAGSLSEPRAREVSANAAPVGECGAGGEVPRVAAEPDVRVAGGRMALQIVGETSIGCDALSQCWDRGHF